MTRKEYIKLLRTTKKPQCTKAFKIGKSYCAIGLGLQKIGVPTKELPYQSSMSVDIQKLWSDYLPQMGLNLDEYYNVVKWNDEDLLSFPEIADRLEAIG